MDFFSNKLVTFVIVLKENRFKTIDLDAYHNNCETNPNFVRGITMTKILFEN